MRCIPAFFLALTLGALCYGQQAPSFTARAMDGSVISMDKLRGKIVVVNLWYVGCEGCVAEIKHLNKLVDEYKGSKDVVFLAPAASTKPQIENFFKKNPFSFTVLPNAHMIIIGKFGSPDKRGEINVPFPMHLVYDRDGKQLVKVQGIKGVEAVRKELQRQFGKK